MTKAYFNLYFVEIHVSYSPRFNCSLWYSVLISGGSIRRLVLLRLKLVTWGTPRLALVAFFPASCTDSMSPCVLRLIHVFSLLTLVTCMFPASCNGCYFLAFCIAYLFSRVLRRLHVFSRPYTQVACFLVPGSCKCGWTRIIMLFLLYWISLIFCQCHTALFFFTRFTGWRFRSRGNGSTHGTFYCRE